MVAPTIFPINVLITRRVERTSKINQGVCHGNLLHIEPTTWLLPKLLNVNAQSCMRKIDEIAILLKEYKIDFACVTESWAGDEVPDSALRIDNFCFPPIRWNRHDRQGGGVVCYIHEDTAFEQLTDLSSDMFEVVWIKLRPHRLPRKYCPLVIGAVYHPPNQNNTEMIQYLTSSIDSVLLRHPNAGLFLMGDFNKLPDRQLKVSYKLKQIVKKPTEVLPSLT